MGSGCSSLLSVFSLRRCSCLALYGFALCLCRLVFRHSIKWMPLWGSRPLSLQAPPPPVLCPAHASTFPPRTLSSCLPSDPVGFPSLLHLGPCTAVGKLPTGTVRATAVLTSLLNFLFHGSWFYTACCITSGYICSLYFVQLSSCLWKQNNPAHYSLRARSGIPTQRNSEKLTIPVLSPAPQQLLSK